MNITLPIDVTKQIGDSPFQGIACSFIKLNDEWGLKAYSCSYRRDTAFNNQKEYFEAGFSIEPGQKIDIQESGLYCYTTRIAEIICQCGETWKREEELTKKYGEQIREEMYAMHQAGLYPRDTHFANWGIFEGRLVLIDLGMDGYSSDYSDDW